MFLQVQTPWAISKCLPNGILLSIMENMAVQDLPAFLDASSLVKELFTAYKTQICVCILVRHLGPVIFDAIMFLEMKDLSLLAEDVQVQRLKRYRQDLVMVTGPVQDLVSLTRGWMRNMTTDQLLELCQFTAQVEDFAQLYASMWEGTMKNKHTGQIPGNYPRPGCLRDDIFVPLSDMERRRLAQAFFRAEIVASRLVRGNFDFFPPCDIEQFYQTTNFFLTLLRFIDRPHLIFWMELKCRCECQSMDHWWWHRLYRFLVDPTRREGLVHHFTAPGRLSTDHPFKTFHDARYHTGRPWAQCSRVLRQHSYIHIEPSLGVPEAWEDATAGDSSRVWGTMLRRSLVLSGWQRQQFELWAEFPLLWWDKWRLDLLKPALVPRMRRGWLTR